MAVFMVTKDMFIGGEFSPPFEIIISLSAFYGSFYFMINEKRNGNKYYYADIELALCRYRCWQSQSLCSIGSGIDRCTGVWCLC